MFTPSKKVPINFLAMDDKIPLSPFIHCTTSSGSLGPFWSRPTEGQVWGGSEMGCLVGSQWGAGKAIFHCSLFTAVSEAHNVFTLLCFQAEAAAWGLCCGSDPGGLFTQGGKVGSTSAGHRLPQTVLAKEIVLSHLQPSGPSVLKKPFPKYCWC